MRWRLFFGYCIFLLSIIACNAIHFLPPISPTHTYNVWVDPHFSLSHQQAIKDAVNEWETQTQHTVRFYFIETPPILGRPLIEIYNIPHTQMVKEDIGHHSLTVVGLAHFSASNGAILIDPDLPDDQFYETALHELGHILGLDHVDDFKYYHRSVMTPFITSSSPHLTCVDIQLFCREWQCDPQSLPLCINN